MRPATGIHGLSHFFGLIYNISGYRRYTVRFSAIEIQHTWDFLMKYLKYCIGFTFLLIVLSWTPSLAEENTGKNAIGIRHGFTALEHDAYFHLNEFYLTYGLPWKKNWDSGWRMRTGLNANLGQYRASNETAFVGSTGPNFEFFSPCNWISLTLGIRAAYLDDHKFGEGEEQEKLGGRLAFIEEAGITIEFPWDIAAGYRYQHQSNAGIYKHNPGIDLHVFEVKYRF